MGDYSILGRNSSSRNMKQKSPWIGNTCLSPKNNLLESQLELASDKKKDTISKSQVPRLKHSESFKSSSTLARDQSENVLKSDREALSEFIQIEKRLAESRFSSANLSKNNKASARLSHKSESQKKLGSQSSRQLITTPPVPSPNMSTGFAQFNTQDMQTYQLSNKIPFKWEKRIKKGVWNADGAYDSLQQRATVSETCATDQADDDSPHHNPFSYSGPKHQPASSKPQAQASTSLAGPQTQKNLQTPAKTKPTGATTSNPNDTPAVHQPARHLPRTNTPSFPSDEAPVLPANDERRSLMPVSTTEQHRPGAHREHAAFDASPADARREQQQTDGDGHAEETWNPAHTFGRPSAAPLDAGVASDDADAHRTGRVFAGVDEPRDEPMQTDDECVEGSVQELSACVSESRLDEPSLVGRWPSALDSVPRTLFHQDEDCEVSRRHQDDPCKESSSDSKQVQSRLSELLEEQSFRVRLLPNIRSRTLQTSWSLLFSRKRKGRCLC